MAKTDGKEDDKQTDKSNGDYVTLNNGVKCPSIGIGTFMIALEDAEVSVREALKMQYELVDQR